MCNHKPQQLDLLADEIWIELNQNHSEMLIVQNGNMGDEQIKAAGQKTTLRHVLLFFARSRKKKKKNRFAKCLTCPNLNLWCTSNPPKHSFNCDFNISVCENLLVWSFWEMHSNSQNTRIHSRSRNVHNWLRVSSLLCSPPTSVQLQRRGCRNSF